MRLLAGRGLGIVGAAFIAVFALAPTSAHAQQISACVSNGNGNVKIVAQGASCSNNEHLVVWGGTIGGANFECATSPTTVIAPGTPVPFQTQVVNFGGSVIYNPVGSFTFARKGIYQLIYFGEFDYGGPPPIAIQLLLNAAQVGQWIALSGSAGTVVGTRLISVQAGDSLILTPSLPTLAKPCDLIIIQVQ